jgi:hypothetical protein
MRSRVETIEQMQKKHEERMAILELGHERHEEMQVKQAETLDRMSLNVQRMVDGMTHLVSIVPLINMAQAMNMICKWLAPPFAIVAGLWAAGHTIYLLLENSGG